MDLSGITSGQFFVIYVESALALTGALLLWMALTGRLRAGHRALRPWPVSVEFFAASVFLIFVGGMGMAYVLQSLPNSVLGPAAKDTEWWQIVLTGGYQGGLLLGVILSVMLIRFFDSGFKSTTSKLVGGGTSVRSSKNEIHGNAPTISAFDVNGQTRDPDDSQVAGPLAPVDDVGDIAITRHKPTTVLHTLGAALVTFAITAFLVNGLGEVWKNTLQASGFETPPQQLVDMFRQGGDVAKMLVMTFLAVVAAPITEELIFRAGLFRYLGTRIPRSLALGIPAVIFAVLHGNAVAFLPLAVLSICFSIAYERTGRIAVPMIAHALFNLHTVLLVMAGVTA